MTLSDYQRQVLKEIEAGNIYYQYGYEIGWQVAHSKRIIRTDTIRRFLELDMIYTHFDADNNRERVFLTDKGKEVLAE